MNPNNLYDTAYTNGENDALSPPFCELLKRFDLHGMRVLDLGCGTGMLSMHLQSLGADVTAVDFSDVAIARAREKKSDISFVCADLTKPFPFDDNVFDLVCDSHTSHCIVDEQKRKTFFKESTRVLKMGGLFLMETMVRSSKMKFPDNYSYDENVLTKRIHLGPSEIDFPYRFIAPSIVIEEAVVSVGLSIQYLTVSSVYKAQIDNIPQTLLPYAPDTLNLIAIK